MKTQLERLANMTFTICRGEDMYIVLFVPDGGLKWLFEVRLKKRGIGQKRRFLQDGEINMTAKNEMPTLMHALNRIMIARDILKIK